MKSHGEAGNRRSAEYKIWSGIKTRCLNTNARAYSRYGGRGIGISERWLKFENFLEDMNRRPSPRHSIDRIDGNKFYALNNCRWATPQQQARNRQSLRPLTIDGVTKLLCEWAEISGVPVATMWDRIYQAGWLPAEAVFRPARHGRPLQCQNGHAFVDTGRWEKKSQRCKVCKKAYDAAYRERTER